MTRLYKLGETAGDISLCKFINLYVDLPTFVGQAFKLSEVSWLGYAPSCTVQSTNDYGG